MTFPEDSVGLALAFFWRQASRRREPRAAADQWQRVAERLHGMRLFLLTASAADPAWQALMADVETLHALADAHYEAAMDAHWSGAETPWEAP